MVSKPHYNNNIYKYYFIVSQNPFFKIHFDILTLTF